MQIRTHDQRCLEIGDDEIIHFPAGLYGFEEYQRYVVLSQEGSLFRFLQSVDEPALAFVLVEAAAIRADYQVQLDAREAEALQLERPEDASVLAVVTIPDDVSDMTANLQAPLIVNEGKGLGKQVVLRNEKYHTRHNILAEMHGGAFRHKRQREAMRKSV